MQLLAELAGASSWGNCPTLQQGQFEIAFVTHQLARDSSHQPVALAPEHQQGCCNAASRAAAVALPLAATAMPSARNAPQRPGGGGPAGRGGNQLTQFAVAITAWR